MELAPHLVMAQAAQRRCHLPGQPVVACVPQFAPAQQDVEEAWVRWKIQLALASAQLDWREVDGLQRTLADEVHMRLASQDSQRQQSWGLLSLVE